ncbi:hypothetical protein B4135_0300 [Caldibacillus debilis]|uniref:Uncharacterized protein n=1 Tax=Caldibacillus debilis TaxID=301148 RepID=A0A150M4U4_9BACI|nr:hypothetical protein B4135_0300 [Caldibacillus debilis]
MRSGLQTGIAQASNDDKPDKMKENPVRIGFPHSDETCAHVS